MYWYPTRRYHLPEQWENIRDFKVSKMGNISKVYIHTRQNSLEPVSAWFWVFVSNNKFQKASQPKTKTTQWHNVLGVRSFLVVLLPQLLLFSTPPPPWLSNTVISDILFSGGPIEAGYCMCYTIAPLPFQLFSRLRIGAMVDFAILNTSQEGSNFNVMFLVSSFPEHLTMLKIGISDQIFIHFHPCWSIDINFNPFSSIHFYPGLW